MFFLFRYVRSGERSVLVRVGALLLVIALVALRVAGLAGHGGWAGIGLVVVLVVVIAARMSARLRRNPRMGPGAGPPPGSSAPGPPPS